MNSETQVIVFTEPGKSNVPYCGVHGSIKNGGGALFAWIPYTTDPGRNCQAVYPVGSTSKIPIVGDLTWPATHELAENATSGAWTINPADNGSEIGDPCNGVVAPFDREPSAGVYVQYLLDRTSGLCADYQAIQPTPNPGSAISALDGGVSCTAVNACMAVGRSFSTGDPAEVTLAEAWNGNTWSVLPTPNPAGSQGSFFNGVSCTSATACTAVGDYINTAGATLTLAEAWNGTKWSIQATPNPSGSAFSLLHAVSCASASACTAVGYSLSATGNYVTVAQGWNGTKWSLQATPNPTGSTTSSLFGVSCTAATACTATGGSTNTGAPGGTPLAEVWNGSKWSIQSMPAFTGGELLGVSCLSATDCTAVGGYFNRTAGTQGTLSASWNGTRWSFNPTVLTGASLSSVSCNSLNECTAVGQLTNGSGAGVTLVEDPFTDGAIESTPNPNGSTGASLSGVSCTAPRTCTAVGSSSTGSGATLTLAEAE